MGSFGPNRARVLVNVRGWAQRAGLEDRQHGYCPAGVIGNKYVFARPVDTQVSRARSFRGNYIQ